MRPGRGSPRCSPGRRCRRRGAGRGPEIVGCLGWKFGVWCVCVCVCLFKGGMIAVSGCVFLKGGGGGCGVCVWWLWRCRRGGAGRGPGMHGLGCSGCLLEGGGFESVGGCLGWWFCSVCVCFGGGFESV